MCEFDNTIKNKWNFIKNNKTVFNKFKEVIEIEYKDFIKIFKEKNKEIASLLIDHLVDGKVILIKKTFSKRFVDELKMKNIQFWKESKPSFHKMLEGCPDYHRIVNPVIAKKYSVQAVRHISYFFPWNNDKLNIREEIYKIWRPCKKLAGLEYNEYEKNTPIDGKIDRIQIACYPPKCGGIERHYDSSKNSPLVVSGYLSSKKNGDFVNGGFYCLNEKNEKIDIEDYIDVGDICIFHSSIEHGVDNIQINKEFDLKTYDWNSGFGRWWLGLFTADSDYIKNRDTSVSLEERTY